MGALAPIQDYVETLVHPSALGDALTAARHRAFIAPRLLGGIAALASFPLYLIARGAPGAFDLFVFAWLVAPVLIAYFLSRTGRYETAHVLSSLALCGLVAMVATATGGIGSFAATWLVIVPLEAALSASRRVVASACALALAAAALLALLGAGHLPPSRISGEGVLTALAVVSATLCATGLAFAAEALARTGLRLRYAEEDRYRLLAGNMTDVITRHGADGGVLFVSPAAESLFGAPVGTLLGQGLFERVHVADRPAYLMALGDAAALAERRSVELRFRRDAVSGNDRGGPQHLWVEMRCRPFEARTSRVADGARREIVAVLRDVSERRRQDELLEQSRLDAEHATRPNIGFLAIRVGAADAGVHSASLSSTPELQPIQSEIPVRKRA